MTPPAGIGTLTNTVKRDSYQAYVQQVLSVCPGADFEITAITDSAYVVEVRTDMASIERLLERDRLGRAAAAARN